MGSWLEGLLHLEKILMKKKTKIWLPIFEIMPPGYLTGKFILNPVESSIYIKKSNLWITAPKGATLVN
jgi:hypothetical protein